MTNRETIAYAIRKEMSRTSLVELCESWGFTIEELEEFLEDGVKAREYKERENDKLKILNFVEEMKANPPYEDTCDNTYDSGFCDALCEVSNKLQEI